ncbi:MAG: hypothetical protein VYC34_08845, partial [Planctomycetota bacterium]|nr:hypothetical protein [Planctomycetota bacterium]
MTTTTTLSPAEVRAIRDVRPETPEQLHRWLSLVLNLSIPAAPLIPSHSAPFHYLCHAFFEDKPPSIPRDCVVWAPRAGGKTFLGALATALDLLFKPGIEVRILAGSLEQSTRMHDHLRALFHSPLLSPFLDGPVTRRRLRLTNGSTAHQRSVAELLAQSETSVRGARPQKLRCDEVELFKPEVWRAAQLMPRTRNCGGITAHAAVECFSTLHKPVGLMADLVASCHPDAEGGPARTLFRWSVIDVLENCPPHRDCKTCPLLEDCDSRAKEARGHITIEDAIAMKRRVSNDTWQSEMLCIRPARQDLVFPEFNPELHVVHDDPPPTSGVPLCAMDFGFRSPAVILWANLDDDGVLRILDEHVRGGVPIQRHIETLRAAPWPRPAWIAIDPAGTQTSDQTATSNAAILRRASYSLRIRRLPLHHGLSAIRARLDPAAGGPTLFIHARCKKLIAAFQQYRWPPENPFASNPVKDGADHPIDALRYLTTS